MKKIIIILSLVLVSGMLSAQNVSYPQNQLPFNNPYAFGLDLSFVLNAEKRGTVYYDTDGTQDSPWRIFRNHGFNWARLMICNEPSGLGQGLDNVVAGARKLKEYNYHFALDFMMSDGWSNPMTQPTPASLKDMSHSARVSAFSLFMP